MSEFTSGYILLASDKEKLEMHFKALSSMKKDYITHPLNTKYLGLFIDVSTIDDELALHIWATNCSNQFPIMYFNTGDHGWSYTLYSDGQVSSQISVNHELDFEVISEWLEQELGQEGVMEFYSSNDTDAYYEKVHASRAYKQAVKAMYSNLNLGAFKVFGLDKNEIKQLKALLSPSFYLVLENGFWKQESEFKKIIGIPEMEWKSYRYLKRDKDEGKS